MGDCLDLGKLAHAAERFEAFVRHRLTAGDLRRIMGKCERDGPVVSVEDLEQLIPA